jgi:hypothetical protein
MERKIYTEKMIWLGTFLGGPLVTGYLFASNFNLLAEPEKAKQSWIWAILTTIVILIVTFLIPEDSNFPNQLIPLVYTIIAAYLFKQFQEFKIQEVLNNEGVAYSWWRVVLISLIGLLVFLVIGVIIFIIADLFAPTVEI